MLKIEPYDLSKSFKFIPEKKKYSLLFYQGNSVDFTSKREAFSFIGKLSILLAPTHIISSSSSGRLPEIKKNERSTTPIDMIVYFKEVIEIIQKNKL